MMEVSDGTGGERMIRSSCTEDAVVLRHDRQGDILRAVIVGHIPEKGLGAYQQKQHDRDGGSPQFRMEGRILSFHGTSPCAE